MITRSVDLTATQAAMLERLGFDLMRLDHADASGVLAIVLKWKVSPISRFGCDVDESAGMAEIVDLHDFSKRVS